MGSLVEILIAMAIFGFLLVGWATLNSSNQFLVENSQLAMSAINLGEELLSSARTALAANFWQDIATSTPDQQFRKDLTISYVNNYIKEIKVKISWKENSKDQFLEIKRLVANPDEAFGTSDCQLSGTESWQSPKISPGPDLGPGNQATSLFARGGIIYLTTNNSNPRDPTSDKNDFFIIDATNASAPFIISKLDTGPGLSSVVVVGDYAYLGNTSINAQLQMADISDLSHPKIVVNYKLPGTYTDATTIANVIFYHLGKIYLGAAKSQIEELHIINVENPLVPKEVGKWEVGAGINGIYVNNHYVYLASPLNEELIVLDIADPNHIQKVAGFDAPGGSGNGKSLARGGDIIYLGRTIGKNELFALNFNQVSSVSNLGSYTVSDSINTMTAIPNILFIGTNNKFEVLSTEDLKKISPIKFIDLPSKVTGLSCSGKILYLSLLSGDGLRIIEPSL
jgi:hypothetical protein